MKISMYQTHAKNEKKMAVYVSALKNCIDIIILATLTYFRNNLLSLRVERMKKKTTYNTHIEKLTLIVLIY